MKMSSGLGWRRERKPRMQPATSPEGDDLGRADNHSRSGRGLVAHPVFKTGRPVQPTGWKVRFLRCSALNLERDAVDARVGEWLEVPRVQAPERLDPPTDGVRARNHPSPSTGTA